MDPTQFLESGASSCSEPQDSVDVCRICAFPDESYIEIYSSEGKNLNLAEKINKYLPISILPTDVLPTVICYECTSTLLAFSDLYSFCIDAKRRLNNILNDQSDIQSCEEEDLIEDLSDSIDLETEVQDAEFTTRTVPSADGTELLTVQIRPIQSQAGQSETKRSTPVQVDINSSPEASFIEEPEDDEEEVTPVELEQEAKKKTKKKKTCMSKCLFCGKVFPYVESLKAHLVCHSDNRPHQCSICEATFKRKDHLAHHRRTVHMNHPEILQDLKSRGLSNFTCEDCGAVRPTLNLMLQHKRKHSPSLACPICKEAFFQSLCLKKHMTKAHPDVKLPCSQCGEVITSGRELYLHNQKHSAGYICDVCGRSFALPATLKIHMALHTDERPHACEECGKTFKLKSRLHLHKKTHSDLRPFVCSICPDKKFKTKTALQAHDNMHNDVRRYPCTHCPFRARKNSDLVNHIRTHTGEKPYKCSVCGRGFAQAGDMRKHQATHDRQKYEISK